MLSISACQPVNVLEMQAVLKIIFQKTSRAIAHAFTEIINNIFLS